MKKRRLKYGVLPLAIGVFGMLSAVGGTTAYLSRSPGELHNVVTAGSAEAVLSEEHWIPEKGKMVYPGETLAKDPTVKNVGKNNIYAFLKVGIPMENVAVIDGKTGRKTARQRRELFSVSPDLKNWQLVTTENKDAYKCYVYMYKNSVAPGEVTSPLFQSVTAIPYLEGELLQGKTYDILVTAEVIQSGLDTTDPSQVYQEFLRQQKEDDEGGKA